MRTESSAAAGAQWVPGTLALVLHEELLEVPHRRIDLLCLARDATFTTASALARAKESEAAREFLKHLARLVENYWEPPMLRTALLTSVPTSETDSAQLVALLSGAAFRNSVFEDWHAGGLFSDDQMPAINRGVRDAIFTALAAHQDPGLATRPLLTAVEVESKALPRQPELLAGYVKLMQQI